MENENIHFCDSAETCNIKCRHKIPHEFDTNCCHDNGCAHKPSQIIKCISYICGNCKYFNISTDSQRYSWCDVDPSKDVGTNTSACIQFVYKRDEPVQHHCGDCKFFEILNDRRYAKCAANKAQDITELTPACIEYIKKASQELLSFKAVCEAIAARHAVQQRPIGTNLDWQPLLHHNIDCDTMEYRLKPSDAWRPWTFEDRANLRNIWIKTKTGHKELAINGFEAEGMLVGNAWRSYKTVFDEYIQLDGNPCGVNT